MTRKSTLTLLVPNFSVGPRNGGYFPLFKLYMLGSGKGGNMQAKSFGDRERLTAEQWRARARQLREFALTILDERTFLGMEQRAKDYELMAAQIDAAADVPPTTLLSPTPDPANETRTN